MCRDCRDCQYGSSFQDGRGRLVLHSFEDAVEKPDSARLAAHAAVGLDARAAGLGMQGGSLKNNLKFFGSQH